MRATCLFDHLSTAKSDLAYEGLLLLWGQNKDSVQRVWELTEPMRCSDLWYYIVMMECRIGGLTLENYFFLHGAGTDSVGSTIPGRGDPPACGNARCAELQCSEWERLSKGGAHWHDRPDPKNPNCKIPGMKSLECDICKKERYKRTAVATGNDDERFQQHPFSSAPYIRPQNGPKYAAMTQRAEAWAERHRRQICWVTAHDRPLHRDDQVFLFLLCACLC